MEDDYPFEKELKSDVSKEVGVDLLREVKQLNRVFMDFTSADIDMLADMMSILEFEPEDQVVAKGEEASFFAIILAGVFHAKVNPELTVPLGKGLILGEMAYFEGGKRNADVEAFTKGIIAVFKFEQLNSLVNLGSAALQCKLVSMLATSSIRKLHNTGNSAPERDDRGKKGAVKKEVLFRKRVGTEKLSREKHLATVEAKADMLEHKARNMEWAMQKETRVLRKSLQEAENEIRDLNYSIKKKDEELNEVLADMQNLQLRHAQEISAREKVLDTAESQRLNHLDNHAELKKEHEQNLRKALGAMKRQNTKEVEEMTELHGLEMKEKADVIAKLQKDHKGEVELFCLKIKELEAEKGMLSKALNDPNLIHKDVMIQRLGDQTELHKEVVALERENCDRLEDALGKTRIKLESLLKWKRTAFEHTNRMQAEQRRMNFEIQEGVQAREMLKSYRTILKYAAVHTFKINFRARKSLKHLHEQIMDLVSHIEPSKENEGQIQLQSEVENWLDNSRRLQALGKKCSVSDLIQALIDAEEVLKCSADHSNAVKDQWKATANRFFERNSVLQHDCMTLREALKHSMAAVSTLKKEGSIRDKQLNVLSGRLARAQEEGSSQEMKLQRIAKKVKQDQLKRSGVDGTMRLQPYGYNPQPPQIQFTPHARIDQWLAPDATGLSAHGGPFPPPSNGPTMYMQYGNNNQADAYPARPQTSATPRSQPSDGYY